MHMAILHKASVSCVLWHGRNNATFNNMLFQVSCEGTPTPHQRPAPVSDHAVREDLEILHERDGGST